MPTATPSATEAVPLRRRAAAVLLFAGSLAAVGLAAATPALAVDDPRRPDARVTHGPSCQPGGVVVEVAGGSDTYRVVLATTRAPGGEDAGEVGAGITVTLRTGEVAWGETVDGWLEYTRVGGDSGTTSGTPSGSGSYVDDLEGYTFTRPAQEDCAAITAPAAPATVPASAPHGAVTPEDLGDGSGPPGYAGTDVVDPPHVDVPEEAGAPAGSGPPATAGDLGSAFGAADGDAPVGTLVAAEPAALGRPVEGVPLFAASLALGAVLTGLAATVRRRLLAPGRRPGSA